ncbi:MAG: NAD(+) synthase [Clostridia bacterium]|nr:NAD(+) synthase [Clostridia bacterium]
MRNYKIEFENRVAFIKSVLCESGLKGIVYGNSGGKDSALVGILCKAACENTVGIILPCTSKRNYDEDAADAKVVAEKYNIETRTVDLTPVKEAELKALDGVTTLNAAALSNIAPRLRMLTLYAVAAAENRLVAGTGNKSEAYVGYFTKWGDGAHDFNPVADLTVTEIYEFLRYLDAPKCVIEKAPSAALFDGQTDETEMGVTYAELDAYLSGKAIEEEKKKIIERMHKASEHKRTGISVYTY